MLIQCDKISEMGWNREITAKAAALSFEALLFFASEARSPLKNPRRHA
jgi:hypothetical protein